MTDQPDAKGTGVQASSAEPSPDGRVANSTDAPEGIVSSLADYLANSNLLSNINASCDHYGIPRGEDHDTNRAKLVLHVVGLSADWAGEDNWKMLVERLTPFCGAGPRGSKEALNKRGHRDFPLGWIPCNNRAEAIRQYIKRLLDEWGVAIPSNSWDLRGMEPARLPTFYLQGCFEHLLSDRKDKFSRFIYIEKALSSWGIYPHTSLFQQAGTFLADILDEQTTGHANAYWSPVKLLNALGVGFQPEKDHKGKAQRSGQLQPWGIWLKPPYDVDFLVSLWLGHVVACGFVEGERRAADKPKSITTCPLTPAESATKPVSGKGSLAGEYIPFPAATALDTSKNASKGPLPPFTPGQQMATPSPDAAHEGRRGQPSRGTKASQRATWPATTPHQVPRLDPPAHHPRQEEDQSRDKQDERGLGRKWQASAAQQNVALQTREEVSREPRESSSERLSSRALALDKPANVSRIAGRAKSPRKRLGSETIQSECRGMKRAKLSLNEPDSNPAPNEMTEWLPSNQLDGGPALKKTTQWFPAKERDEDETVAFESSANPRDTTGSGPYVSMHTVRSGSSAGPDERGSAPRIVQVSRIGHDRGVQGDTTAGRPACDVERQSEISHAGPRDKRVVPESDETGLERRLKRARISGNPASQLYPTYRPYYNPRSDLEIAGSGRRRQSPRGATVAEPLEVGPSFPSVSPEADRCYKYSSRVINHT